MIKILIIILLIICPPVLAQQDVTVNFPDSMTVEGSVQIENLAEDMGITGVDPSYSLDEFQEPDFQYMNYRNNSSFNELITNGHNQDNTTLKYFKRSSYLSLWHGNATGTYTEHEVILQIPVLDFWAVKNDFLTAIFGSYYTSGGTGGVASSSLFPSLVGGRSNLQAPQTFRDVNCSIHDPFGNQSYSYSFGLGSLLVGSYNSGFSALTQGIDFKAFFNLLIQFAIWYEVVYSILGTIRQG